MQCSRYRPISEGATGRPPIYPAGSKPKEFNQRDLPNNYHTRRQSLSKRGSLGWARGGEALAAPMRAQSLGDDSLAIREAGRGAVGTK
jgi:hypothetical protein